MTHNPTSTAKTILCILGVLGILQTWGRSALDGTLQHIHDALHNTDGYILPGTNDKLRKSFTGIYWPIDHLLDVLVVFFWEVVDGSHPTTSVIGTYFGGQLFAIVVGFYQDGVRGGRGSRGGLLRPTLWLLSTQMFAVAGSGWIWALMYIASSPTASTTISRSALQAASQIPSKLTMLITPAVILGYIFPAVLMGLPSPTITTNNFKQLAVVAWNVYPLIILIILWISASMTGALSHQSADRSKVSPREHLRAVRWSNSIALGISSVTHISICAVSFSTILFPDLFNTKYTQALRPASIFLPPISINRGNTVGDGVRSFLMWDQICGCSVVILVMLVQLRTATIATGKKSSWIKSIGAATLISCVAGPGSASLAISWWRDEMVFGDGVADGDGEKKD